MSEPSQVTEGKDPKTNHDKTKTGNELHESGLVYYGDSSLVNDVDKVDYAGHLTNTLSKQSMSGFDDDYLDIVDYIIKCTHRIWEEKGFGLIYTHYHNDAVVYTGAMSSKGVNSVVSASIQSSYAFPDRKAIGERVIWSGNDKEGFYTSHRILSIATNLGESVFGPATGKKVAIKILADCLVFENKIIREWLIRDNLHLVRQLGFDEHELARKLSKENSVKPGYGFSELMDGQLLPAVYERKSNSFEIGDFVLEVYNKIFERRLFNYVKTFYSDNAAAQYICDHNKVGHDQIQSMLVSIFASMPCAKFLIERITCNQNKINQNEWDVAVRWRLQGLHEGIGFFGAPGNKFVEIPGISHLKVNNEKIVEELTLFDGLDVLRQICNDKEVCESETASQAGQE